MLRLMKTALWLAVVLGLSGCTSKNVRPKTAVELCERFKDAFEGKTECAPVIAAEKLTMMQAVEAAVLTKRVPDPAGAGADKLTDVAWIAYTDPRKEPTVGMLLQMLGRELAGVALLEEHNDAAKVGVYVVRGELGAEGWTAVSKQVRELKPVEAQPRID
jgi:hypothetical protein